MKKLLLITYLIPLFFSIAVASQDAQNEQLAELLEKLDGGPGSLSDSAVLQPDAEGYKSFVQNELQNIFSGYILWRFLWFMESNNS